MVRYQPAPQYTSLSSASPSQGQGPGQRPGQSGPGRVSSPADPSPGPAQSVLSDLEVSLMTGVLKVPPYLLALFVCMCMYGISGCWDPVASPFTSPFLVVSSTLQLSRHSARDAMIPIQHVFMMSSSMVHIHTYSHIHTLVPINALRPCPAPCLALSFRAAPGLRNDLRRPGHGLLAHPDLQAQGQAESAGLSARQGDRRSQPCRPGEVRSGQVRIPRSMCDVCVYGR